MTDESKTPTPLSKRQAAVAEITTLLKARTTLFWMTTREEYRVERAIVDAAAAAKYPVVFWDCATGLTEITVDAAGQPSTKIVKEGLNDPGAILSYIREPGSAYMRAVFILRDLPAWLRDPSVLRNLRSLVKDLKVAPLSQARSIVLLTTSGEIPPDLVGHSIVYDFPLPDRIEMTDILDSILRDVPQKMWPVNGTREAAIDAALGLTADEAAACFNKSLVSSKAILVSLIADEKKRVIARDKLLTWYDPDPRGLDAVGGLEEMKAWLTARKSALSVKARAYGLPTPKGVFLAGPPGTGKSASAKAIAAAWQMPLLKLDSGAMKSKFVGESEGNIRKALAIAETVAPCVLWIDEIEKALAGSTGTQGDGGVGADQLGTILTWMQEKKAPVFVVATANEVRNLPPELLRKGRFDELFFVDLPTATERVAILAASLTANGQGEGVVDLAALVDPTDGFVGAEIAAIVPDAMFVAFADGGRPITTKDLIEAARKVTPLSKTAAEKIEDLRKWAKGRCRPASREESTAKGSGGRLDLGE